MNPSQFALWLPGRPINGMATWIGGGGNPLAGEQGDVQKV